MGCGGNFSVDGRSSGRISRGSRVALSAGRFELNLPAHPEDLEFHKKKAA
jgi:hypothetical protein